jgi:hypothetical protein
MRNEDQLVSERGTWVSAESIWETPPATGGPELRRCTDCGCILAPTRDRQGPERCRSCAQRRRRALQAASAGAEG